MFVYIYICYLFIQLYTHMHIYIYIYLCILILTTELHCVAGYLHGHVSFAKYRCQNMGSFPNETQPFRHIVAIAY